MAVSTAPRRIRPSKVKSAPVSGFRKREDAQGDECDDQDGVLRCTRLPERPRRYGRKLGIRASELSEMRQYTPRQHQECHRQMDFKGSQDESCS